MSKATRRPLRVLFTACLALLALWWALWGMDIDAVLAALLAFDPAHGAVVVLLFIGVLLVRTRRAQLLLPPGVPFVPLVPEVALGFMATVLVPLGVGALVRPWLLHKRFSVPLGTGIAVMLIERIYGILLLLMLVVYVSWTSAPDNPILVGGVDLILAARGALMVLCGAVVVSLGTLVWIGPDLRRRALDLATRDHPPLARVVAQADGMFSGLDHIAAQPRRSLAAFGWSMAFFALAIAAARVTLDGFDGLEPGMHQAAVFWTSTVAAMSAMPTPGGIGAFEAGGVAALVWDGHDPDTSRAATVTFHALTLGANVGFGLVVLLARGTSLGELLDLARKGRDPEEA